MAKASGLTICLVLALVITFCPQGPACPQVADAAAATIIPNGAMRRMLQLQDDDIVATPCNGYICTTEFYNTAYVTCKSNEGQLTAYANCCVLKTCKPDVSGCTLHLKDNAGTVACNF
ncbi:hypothetical protein GOP47_0009508 [Adiantum capillus-veneris]|uniref:Uncharacterized protein n=1 Tax=Adiantum capillus-veneris TaxID=13818 RepID=A0A9D4UXX3_ADICA|nr:hypothetical protein GOP47_0009508 [Adiantum capillus-veneris]